ncbi:MAG: Z1 domain-containing protein [bacterium]
MSKLEALLAYFRVELAQIEPRTRESVRNLVESSPMPLSEDQQSEIIRVLEASFDIEQSIGSTIRGQHKPWLNERRAKIDFFYWERLKKYYIGQNALPLQVISILDQVTDEILDFCGDPDDERAWSQRGMVMGHVQSGKTTNYASLICKAADAGYKVVILLAGITNSLRSQTQERLDETFIGKKSVFQSRVAEQLSVTNYAEARRFPAYGTSRDGDFSKKSAETWGVTLSALSEPIIFVTKKNKSTLEHLRDWLKRENQGNQIRHPLLLIDDEADNASINTAKDPGRVTAINAAIREILGLFSRSTYIGYTATPFANIFIDPESEDEMLCDDLFPRSFIKALDPPTNYCGARRIFSESGDLRSMIRTVGDYEETFPLKHKKDHPIEALPASLNAAIRGFVLARAIRVLRGDGASHASMMINVSRFNDVQDRVHGLVYKYMEDLKNSILMGAKMPRGSTRDMNLSDLQMTFNDEYSSTEFTFDDLLRVLPDAVPDIAVRTVNMRGGKLDYSKHKKTGLRVIAIGGLALSRGLTLEGLIVTYMLRNVAASDTLMQMARWFGYRDRYADICRLYLPDQSIRHYQYISDSIEELRAEVKSMAQTGLTPENFGLKVRHSPAAIRITAANKMRAATALTVAQDYAGRHVEGYALPASSESNSKNLDLVRTFVRELGAASFDREQAPTWRGVPAARVLRLLTDFQFAASHTHLSPIQGDRSLFSFYVEDRTDTELAHWDVVLPVLSFLNDPDQITDRNFGYRFRKRGAGQVSDGTFKVTPKNKAANPEDERLPLSSDQEREARRIADDPSVDIAFSTACCLQLRSPALLLHIFEVDNDCKDVVGSQVATLSFCMPLSNIPAKERTYQVNKVYLEQLRRDLVEPDDDDTPILDEAINV